MCISDRDEPPERNEINQWKDHFETNGVGMVTVDVAIVDHRMDKLRLPDGVN